MSEITQRNMFSDIPRQEIEGADNIVNNISKENQNHQEMLEKIKQELIDLE